MTDVALLINISFISNFRIYFITNALCQNQQQQQQKLLSCHIPIASSQLFATVVPLRESGEVNVNFFFSLRTEFFVSVFQAKISTEVYIFSETASFTPFIVKLSQWVKLSPNDIIAKMFLPH